jgi:hypothetical protein
MGGMQIPLFAGRLAALINGATALGAAAADADKLLLTDQDVAGDPIRSITAANLLSGAGGGAWTFIKKENATEDQYLTLTDVFSATYNRYRIELWNIQPEVDNSAIRSQFGYSSGASWQGGLSDYKRLTTAGSSMNHWSGIGNAAGEKACLILDIFERPKQYTSVLDFLAVVSSAGSRAENRSHNQLLAEPGGALDSIRFFPASGNWMAQGSAVAWGIADS